MAYYLIQQLFQPGEILVCDSIISRGFKFLPFLKRHITGDWGDISEYDRTCNDQSLEDNSDILSQYAATDTHHTTELIAIVTAADRSYTVIFLP